jgi:hypothetical protein
MRRLTLTLVPLLLLACGREPVAPSAAARPSYSAISNWTRASLFLNNVVDVTCLAESVTFSGEVPYTLHQVTSAGGPSGYTYRFVPVTPNTPQFSAVGKTSGTTYWYRNGLPYNETFRNGPGQVLQLKWHETYVAENGRDRLYNDGSLHMTTSPNGELVVNRYESLGVRCEK